MNRLFNGFCNILLLLGVMGVFFALMALVIYFVTHFTWLNLIWIIPVFFCMCYIFGEEEKHLGSR